MDNSIRTFGIQVDFNRIWEAHEKELMIFPAEEYDAGASLHAIKHQQCSTFKARSMERRGTSPLTFFKFELNEINCCKAGRAKAMPSSML
jgi:hypothetical protein